MNWESNNSVQLTVALTVGLGCGMVIGALLTIRRRKAPSLQSGKEVSEKVLSFRHVSDEYKLVFVVRNDLKMGKGKVAAQCGHAAIGAYKQIKSTNPKLLNLWEDAGCMKVVVKAPDEQAFFKASTDAARLGLNTHIVRDAGRTQVTPGSSTILCVGPGNSKEIDTATGHLKLY